MRFSREVLLVAIGIGASALGASSLRAPALAGPVVVAQATSPALLSGTPEPTEEPTTPPSDALVAAAAVGPEWAAFAKIAVDATDFISTVKAHESVGGVEFTKTIKISSKKPNYARCEIIDGDGVGSVAVWRGGDKVQGHEGGQHRDIVVVLPRHNKRVTDLLGNGCGDTSPDRIVGYVTHNGKLSESPGPTIGTDATDDITWIPNPGDMVRATKEDFYISKSTHLIVATKGYAGDKLVEDSTWTLTVNPGLKYSVFDIGN